LSSTDTVCILSLLLFLARYINIVYLLDPQLPACMPIKLDPSHKPPGRLNQLRCFGHVNGVHSLRCNKTRMQDSLYVWTEGCFSYALRRRRCEAVGFRLSPKRNTYTERILRRNPPSFAAANSLESGNCWNPNWVIRCLEAGSKTMGSLCIRVIQFRVTILYICV
jgi:hypothetical protein